MPPAAAAAVGAGTALAGTIMGAVKGTPKTPDYQPAVTQMTPEGRALLQDAQTRMRTQLNKTPEEMMSRSNAAFGLRDSGQERAKRMDMLMRQRLGSMPGTVGGAAPQMTAGAMPGVIGGAVPNIPAIPRQDRRMM